MKSLGLVLDLSRTRSYTNEVSRSQIAESESGAILRFFSRRKRKRNAHPFCCLLGCRPGERDFEQFYFFRRMIE